MKVPDNLPDNDEHFTAWFFDELAHNSVNPGEELPRPIALAYDKNENAIIEPLDCMLKKYSETELFI